MLGLGFGFAEVGTTTPRPQQGNDRPRVFRLKRDRAVINRLGFNNEGHDAAFERLVARRGRGVVGINIGANKDADDRIADYVTGIRRFYTLASYFTVNVSSPNTPGLRDMQGRAQLAELLARVGEVRAAEAEIHKRAVPVFLKIAPDITDDGLDDIVAEVTGKGLDGMIVSNTTLSRTGLARDPGHDGGLSGKPLFERSTILLARTRQRAGPELALIGAGGVDSAATALAKIEAGRRPGAALYRHDLSRPGDRQRDQSRPVSGAGQERRGVDRRVEGQQDGGVGEKAAAGVSAVSGHAFDYLTMRRVHVRFGALLLTDAARGSAMAATPRRADSSLRMQNYNRLSRPKQPSDRQ